MPHEPEHQRQYEGFKPEHPFKGINLGLLVMLAFIWTVRLFVNKAPVHWDAVGLGAATAMVLCCWVFNITGGRIPESWRRKLPRR